MASPVKAYQKEMHRNIGFFATWLPGDNLELGEAGVFKGGRFSAAASLAELGIAFEAGSPGSPQTLQYTSASGTAVSSSASANAMNLARAEISVEFSSEGAFLFQASGVKQIRIEDRVAVRRAILDAYEHGKWDKNWWMVESLYRAKCATVIISQDTSSAMVLEASADTPLGSLPLANPDVNLSIKSTRGKVFHLIAGRSLAPLYACLRVKDPLIGPPRVEAIRGIGDDAQVSFDRPSIDELLES